MKSLNSIAFGLVAMVAANPAFAILQNLNPESDFFKELRIEPVPADPVDLLLRSALLSRTKNHADGTALSNSMDRRRILELIAEPFKASSTIGQAISQENAEPEKYEALHRRAMDSLLTVERAPDSTPEMVKHTGRIAYLGNSVWQGGATNRLLWMRVKVTSKTTLPVQIFGIAITHPAEPGRQLDFWQCTFENGDSLAPKTTDSAVCLDSVDIDKPAAALAAVTTPTLSLPIKVTRIELIGYRFISGITTLPEDNNRLSLARSKADLMLQKLPCEKIDACEKIAEQKTEEKQRAYYTSPEYFEQERLKRSAKALEHIKNGFVLMLLLIFGSLFVSLPEQHGEGRTGSIAAFAILPLGMLVLGGMIPVMLELPATRGYGGFLFIIPAIICALILGILSVLLGSLMLTPENRTRLRLAMTGFGISVLYIVGSAFNH